MDYPNSQTVSDVKKSVSSNVSRAASDLKSEAKSVANKVERKVGQAGQAASDFGSDVKSELKSETDFGSDSASSTVNNVISSALSLLPIKNADEVVSMLQSTVKDIRSSAITARDSATAFVKKYPVYSVLGAVAIGAGAIMLFKMRGSTPARDTAKYDA